MNEIQDTQTIASLDAEQFGNVALGLMQACGAMLWRTETGACLMECEDGTPCVIDPPSVTVEFLFYFGLGHTN